MVEQHSGCTNSSQKIVFILCPVQSAKIQISTGNSRLSKFEGSMSSWECSITLKLSSMICSLVSLSLKHLFRNAMIAVTIIISFLRQSLESLPQSGRKLKTSSLICLSNVAPNMILTRSLPSKETRWSVRALMSSMMSELSAQGPHYQGVQLEHTWNKTRNYRCKEAWMIKSSQNSMQAFKEESSYGLNENSLQSLAAVKTYDNLAAYANKKCTSTSV